MRKEITIGAAQLGPIARSDSRKVVVERLIELMRKGKKSGCDVVVYPELALTSFFPRWYMEHQEDVDSFFEHEMPGTATKPLFQFAIENEIGFYLGYAELSQESGTVHRYNTSILVDKFGKIVGKFRKVHIPGHFDHEPSWQFQHLEKRYFESGNLGFPVWESEGVKMGMCICNDRRWPETYRVMGLQGVEVVLLGYNTPTHYPPNESPEADALTLFHNHLSMQAGAYQNSTWVVGVAKAGCEEGCDMIGQSAIIAPSGEIVAQSVTLGDELVAAVCDLDLGRPYRENHLNLGMHREIDSYQLITERKGVGPPLGKSSSG